MMIKVIDDFIKSDMISSEQSRYHKDMWCVADQLLTSPGQRISKADVMLSNKAWAFLKSSPVFTFHHGDVSFNTRAHATFAARRRRNAASTRRWWRTALWYSWAGQE
jgi:hypothetical protein